MGPSGAGKTVLVSTLTLDALFGRATGTVTLNGVPLSNNVLKQHAYVVVQHDKLWPYLTCRETLQYAGELYGLEGIDEAVKAIIRKLGLDVCADVRNSGLSGGQQKRLSLGLALLKSPTLLFLGASMMRMHHLLLFYSCLKVDRAILTTQIHSFFIFAFYYSCHAIQMVRCVIFCHQ